MEMLVDETTFPLNVELFLFTLISSLFAKLS